VSAFALSLLLVATPWREFAPGLEYVALPYGDPTQVADPRLHVVRFDPQRMSLKPVVAALEDGQKRTAAQWAEREGLAVAINLGMFELDHSSNVGHLRIGEQQLQPRWHAGHRSTLVWCPKRPVQIVDLDPPGERPDFARCEWVIQNLRVLKGEGTNVWPKRNQRWSEAAIGQDRAGRIHLIFTRAPRTMHEFAEFLRKELDLVRAMHVEGGPEASLSIHTPELHLDLAGSYETGFNENDHNDRQWPIPNVLGVQRTEVVTRP
jgi:hypothetical protein